eukprot:SAG22_NODE_404_length_11005_cov_8.751788_11_plen_67_part_00
MTILSSPFADRLSSLYSFSAFPCGSTALTAGGPLVACLPACLPWLQHAFLTVDEVIAIRLYAGPVY